jgi:hypothetical protein
MRRQRHWSKRFAPVRQHNLYAHGDRDLREYRGPHHAHSNGEELRNTEAVEPRLLEGFADAGAGFLQLFGQAGDLALKVG